MLLFILFILFYKLNYPNLTQQLDRSYINSEILLIHPSKLQSILDLALSQKQEVTPANCSPPQKKQPRIR